MKKIYFKFLLIAFSTVFIIMVTFFYIGYLKREQLKREKLRIVEIKEIISILKENTPFDNEKLELLKEIEKSYNVMLFLKTPYGFTYYTDKKLLSPHFKSKFVPIKRFRNLQRNKRFPVFMHRIPRNNTQKANFLYYIDKKTKTLRGASFKSPDFEVLIFKSSENSFSMAFFTLIFVIFTLSGTIFYLIRKWYVTPLINLEHSIKAVERNLNSPELYRDSTGTLTPIFNALNNLKRTIIYEINSKEEMLRDISHDLKTPLSRIKLAVEFVENEKIKRSIKEDVQELEELIEKILEMNTIKKQECRSSLKHFFEEMEVKYSSIEFRIECKEEIIIPVCKQDLKRIFYNLVDNTLKFADITKGVFITAKKINDKVKVNYKDCSTKGEKPDIERMFDYFYKKDNARNKSINNGFGLGLSIVKKTCEQYGGRISAKISDCDGIEFIIEFPLC